jgi:hypothetical protein
MAPTDELIADILSELMSRGWRDIFFLNVRMIRQYYLPDSSAVADSPSRDLSGEETESSAFLT